MKKISGEFILAFILVLFVFGYFQGVVVPKVASKYIQEAAVIKSGVSSSGTAKSLSPCNPVQTKCGKLVIIKDAVPDNYQDFTFVHQTIPGYVQTFTLDDDATPTLSNTAMFYTPYNGTFLVAEVVNASYNVTIACTDPSGGTTISGAIATISMYQGEAVTCTFKNVPVSTTTACTPNTWTQKADFGGGIRWGAVGFSIGAKGYVGTGKGATAGDPPFKDFWEYNPVTNVWTQKADFGGAPRYQAFGFSIGAKGYVGTGLGIWPSLYQDFWEYNPVTNVWTQKANFVGVARSGAVGFSIGTKGYAGTGVSVGSAHQDFYEYNPTTNVWTQKADFGGGPRFEHVGFSIGNKGYMGTGQDYTGTPFYQDFWEYNPVTNLWTQKADFGGGDRRSEKGFSIGTKGYVGIGWGPGGSQQDFWEYNPTTNVWTQKANFGGAPRSVGTGFSIGNKGYLGTGIWPLAQDWWEYCP